MQAGGCEFVMRYVWSAYGGAATNPAPSSSTSPTSRAELPLPAASGSHYRRQRGCQQSEGLPRSLPKYTETPRQVVTKVADRHSPAAGGSSSTLLAMVGPSSGRPHTIGSGGPGPPRYRQGR